MNGTPNVERVETLVIGGGQAGLSVGYHLKRLDLPFAIVDANERVGDAWRSRWDSLRLFTAARFDSLDGMPFPARYKHEFPTKDEMGDYLEAYARQFELPVHTGVRVDYLSRQDGRFLVGAGDQRFEAENVVVAMANYQQPGVPAFAPDLDPRIVQFHSAEYRNPSQWRYGDVLIVGAGNSGSEIAMEAARHGRKVWMAGRDTGAIPFRIEGLPARLLLTRLVIRGLFYRVLTVNTPIGRKMRPKFLTGGGPLIRVKPSDLKRAGVERVPRVTGVRDGLPLLEDGRVLDVPNVVWCTGYHPGFSWIDLPVLGEHEPDHHRGVVESVPGLYFVGLEFLYALSSIMIHGVGRDAAHVAKHIQRRRNGLANAPRAEESELPEPARSA
jgi:putative flavoprotein involved in K+ transport